MSDSLRAGVVGAGVFGGFHARKYAELDGVTFAGAYDINPGRAREMVEQYGGQVFASLEDLLAAVDVVTIASPATAHAAETLAALRAGKSVYVEKPVATTLEDTDRIVAEAAARGLAVAVGHQERVIFQAMGLLDAPQKPLRLEAVRLGTPSERNHDVSAVLDLMVHDLDLALALTDADPIAVEADGDEDQTTAEVTFADGFTASFETSRIAPERRRTMKIVYPSGELEIDFVARTFHNSTGFALDEHFAETPSGRDPLGESVREFIDAVRGVRAAPLVTAAQAERALDLALAVEQAAGF